MNYLIFFHIVLIQSPEKRTYPKVTPSVLNDGFDAIGTNRVGIVLIMSKVGKVPVFGSRIFTPPASVPIHDLSIPALTN